MLSFTIENLKWTNAMILILIYRFSSSRIKVNKTLLRNNQEAPGVYVLKHLHNKITREKVII